MKSIIRFLIIILLFGLYNKSINAQEILKKLNITSDVIKTIPTPGSNCQGLTWDGEYLWVSDIDKDSIYQIDTLNGNIIHQIRSSPATHLFEGLAWDGEYLWASHYKSMYITEPTISRIDPVSGNVLHSATIQVYKSWPHGIAWDGEYIWENDFTHHKIYKINQNNGAVLDSIDAPGDDYSIGLTWYNGYLISSDCNTDSIYQINPVTKQIENQWFCPYTNPRDMTFDGECFWFIAREVSLIYKIKIIISEIENESPNSLISYNLSQNFPNPFNPSTKISWQVPLGSWHTIKVFDVLGNEIATLVDEYKQAGSYESEFKADGLPSGVYFYRLQAGDFVETKKMILLR
jgi:glutamine cyclotransferase